MGASHGGSVSESARAAPLKWPGSLTLLVLDEGTCGRRRLRLGSFGLYGVVENQADCFACPSYPLRLTSAGNRLPEFGCWRLAGFLPCAVDDRDTT